ncbi:MAG: GldG family protein [Candidatus Adiutrix sp.]|jgi:hypothetical protein|nr:GldG family protein [Candidatus Adiutrix sp.]
MNGSRRLCLILSLLLMPCAGLGHLAAPDFLGFTVLPLALAAGLAVLAGGEAWRALGRATGSPLGRGRLRAFLALMPSLALALALGRMNFLPAFDFSRDRVRSPAPETLEILGRLDQPLRITVHMGPQNPRLGPVRELMRHYEKHSGGLISVTYLNPQTEAAGGPDGPRLARPDVAELAAENFWENISPVNEETLNSALSRLIRPQRRLIYFLNTFGEKLAQDRGPGGLSQWAGDLGGQRLTVLDYHWPEGQPLPGEAAALVLAGPRAPLGEDREALLLDYLKRGGKVLLMTDPLTVTVSPDFWALFGLSRPEGLVLDPETTLAGTGDSFVVSHDYAPHALTRGLSRPILWPLVGAFQRAGEGPAGPPAVSYALATSSPASWLETDPASLARGDPRYQADSDRPGPLVLAVAVELEGGGRLLALADSDLAANGFWGQPGNREFCSAAVHWLLDGQALARPFRSPVQSLILSRISARLFFWLPAVFWPALVLGLWLIFYGRRRRRSPAPPRSPEKA